MTQQEILESNLTKSEKMRRLFDLGLTRQQVADLVGTNYGFAQNVFQAYFRTGRFAQQNQTTYFDFIFNRKFGVEIEAYNIEISTLVAKLNEAGITTRNENYNHSTRNHWKIVTDGSLQGNNTFEIVSPILEGEDGINQLKIVCRVLKQLNAKINKTCGLHIHFDAQDFSLTHWKNIYKNYVIFENSIDAFMPNSRRGNNNQYCKSMNTANNINATLTRIHTATSLEMIERRLTDRNRYYKLNTQSFWRHKTIEFRQHSGTIEFEKISNWIFFLARMIEFSKTKISEDGTQNGFKQFCNEELNNYISERTANLR